MTKIDKSLSRIEAASRTCPYLELVKLLERLGYEKIEMAGSRVRFWNPSIKHMILLHRPHPDKEIKGGALRAIKQTLKERGFI